MTPSDGALDLAEERSTPTPLNIRVQRYQAVRAATLALTTSLSAEDQTVQSMPDASPVKWHQAHTTWFFETFMLAPFDPGYRVFDPLFGYLFNSYYESVGPRRPRPARGLVTRPSLSEVRAYRRYVDQAMTAFLASDVADHPDVEALLDLGLAHEQQHQELILMDVLHLFAQMPGYPAYRPVAASAQPDPGPMRFIDFEGGVAFVGHGEDAFAFDNETPRHQVLLQPFRLADRLVTNGEWLRFIEAGGYQHAEYWLSDGWAQINAEGWSHPIYWRQDENGVWSEVTLGGLQPLDPDAPVAHVSYYEADAYARWAGARLPTEMEWEHAAAGLPVEGGFLDLDRLAPNGPALQPGLRQMFGELWQWTRSPYAPYPGFQPGPGAVGEYNGKFMVNQMVLRGGCCATPPGHVRATYRNFFYPHQSWAFTGVRLAADAPAATTPAEAFEADAIAGLSATPKRLPSKYFYDERGSTLFEDITELPEYYLTRTEVGLLTDAAPAIASHISPGAALIEFGSGASVKTRLVLDAAPQVGVYIPMDISEDALEPAAAAIRAAYPKLAVAPLVGDFTQPIDLPAAARGRPRTGFFPGSTIGNFGPDEAVEFLRSARRLLGEGAQFIVGADLVKDESVLLAAYDDAQGVTADFNMNLLARINRELGGDIDLSAFEHRAVWNPVDSRMEMHLVSKVDQTFHVTGRPIHMAAGETIHTENSYKFAIESFTALAERAGWRMGAIWTSRDPAFAVFLLQDWR